jgi:EmrB/QacA subfamily drug resistance transporter
MIKKLEYKYIVAIIYVMTLFLDRMDLTITNVAMPAFAKDFKINIAETDWIATSFLISLGVSMLMSGWLSDKYGSKKIFIFSNILFIFSSLLCALSWNLNSLIFFRVLQGIGGGLLIPVGMSMTYRAFTTKEYPKLANYTLIPTLVAPSIAPAIGGIILEFLNWHWIFFLHLPIGLISITCSFLFLKEDHEFKETSHFDFFGFIILSLFLSSLFFFLSRVGLYGFSQTQTKISGLIAITSFFVFIYSEKYLKNPIINFNFFKIKLFRQANILQLLMQICYFGSIFLIAVYFQNCLGMSPLQCGFAMTGQSLGTICMLFFSSKFFHKFGPKYLVFTGFIFISMTTYCLLAIKNPNQLILSNCILWLRGLSIGLINGPLQACIMFDLSKSETAKGSAILNIVRQLGISLGVALSCLILAVQMRNTTFIKPTIIQTLLPIQTFKVTFTIFSGIAILAAIIALTIDNERILKKLHSHD